jgi:hypothetical protein
LAVQALACEYMGLKGLHPHMGDVFRAQLWLRAIMATLHVLSGKSDRVLNGCGARPITVHVGFGLLSGYVGLPHPAGGQLVGYGGIRLGDGPEIPILDWGEEVVEGGKVVAAEACVSLVGSAVVGTGVLPGEMEVKALEVVRGLLDSPGVGVPRALRKVLGALGEQLASRVLCKAGLLTPDAFRVWLPLFAPHLMVVVLQIESFEWQGEVRYRVRPQVYRVPGVEPSGVAGILMMDVHLYQLDIGMTIAEVEGWLAQLPMFVPDLWCLSPELLGAFGFGMRPCGRAGAMGVDDESGMMREIQSEWELSEFQEGIGLDQCWAEFGDRWLKCCGKSPSVESVLLTEGTRWCVGVLSAACTGVETEGEARTIEPKAAGGREGPKGGVGEQAPVGPLEADPESIGTIWGAVAETIWESRSEFKGGLSVGAGDRLRDLRLKCLARARQWDKDCIPELAKDRGLQAEYSMNTSPWIYSAAEAADLLGSPEEWPPLLEASIRDAQGCVDPNVSATRVEEFFGRMEVPPEQVDLMARQVLEGQSLVFREKRVRFRGKMLPSAKGYEREIAAQCWTDASRKQSIIGDPGTLPAMDKGKIQCHPTGRVPKSDTSTGLATSKGRLIAHLSFQPITHGVLKYMSRNQSVERPFGRYNLAKHQDLARLWCQAKGYSPAAIIAAQKDDGNYYFKNWFFAVMQFGEIASEFAGHTVLDRTLVFGLKPAPEITHFGGTDAIEQALNSGWIDTGLPVHQMEGGAAGESYSPGVEASLEEMERVKEVAERALRSSREEEHRQQWLPVRAESTAGALRLLVNSGVLSRTERGLIEASRNWKSGPLQHGNLGEWRYLEVEELLEELDPLYRLAEEDVTPERVMDMAKCKVLTDLEVMERGVEDRVVPSGGAMFVDDEMILALVTFGIFLAVRAHGVEALVARLGSTGLSTKAILTEMVFKVVQTMIGQLMDCLRGEFRPTPARISKFRRYLVDHLARIKERRLTAGQAYAPYSLGLWIAVGVWWLKAFVHELKTPLNGFCTMTGSKDSEVVPNRKGVSIEDSWNSIEDATETLLELETMRHKLPWRTSMVQMLPGPERLTEATGNFSEVETDACIWGAGGVNIRRREFFRAVHPEWVRGQIEWAMAQGLDETTALHFTIALVELAAVYLAHILWGGRRKFGNTPEDVWNVVDNTNTEAWMEKLWAAPVLASRYLRGLAVIALRRQYNGYTSGKRSKMMVFADPLSRVFEHGVFDVTAMEDFRRACHERGILDGMREVIIPEALLDHVFPVEISELGNMHAQVASLISLADQGEYETVEWGVGVEHVPEHCRWHLPKQLVVEKHRSGQSARCGPAEAGEPSRMLRLVKPPLGAKGENGQEGTRAAVGPGRSPKDLPCLIWDCRSSSQEGDERRRLWKLKMTETSQVDGNVTAGDKWSQSGFTRGELEPLMPQCINWDKRPSLTVMCYGIGGSALGWVAEGFNWVAGSEIDAWCVERAGRLFPEMVQLGDLEKLTPELMPKTDVLIVGTACTAVSILGMLRGLADQKMKHMLIVARLAVTRGYKLIVFEMVPSLLAYDGGAIAVVLENILREAGYEVSRRVDHLFPNGGGAVRPRLYFLASNPCYGKHEDLPGVSVQLRMEGDPARVVDIMDPPQLADQDLFHDLSQVRWKQGPLNLVEGKPCWVGSMHGGGVGFRGIPGRVLLYLGALSTVIASGNVGAVLGWDSAVGWYLRELAPHELKRANTLCQLQKLPPDQRHAFRVVGNCEPPRMAQALARTVGPWLKKCELVPPGRVPSETPERTDPVGKTTWEEVMEAGVNPISVRDQISLMRPRLRDGLPGHTCEERPTLAQCEPAMRLQAQAVRMAAVEAERKVQERQKERMEAAQLAQAKEVRRVGGRTPCGRGGAMTGVRFQNMSREVTCKTIAKMNSRSAVANLYPLKVQGGPSGGEVLRNAPRIVAARAAVEAAALKVSTSTKYKNQMAEYVAHCEYCDEDPFQVGKPDKAITEHMVYFVLCRYEYAGNKYGTIRGYLSAIRWHFLEEEFKDPTKGGWLTRILRGVKNLRGGVDRKLPLTKSMLAWIWNRKGVKLSKVLATAVATVTAYFFLLRICEVAAQDSRTLYEHILRRNQVKFFREGQLCQWKDDPDEVALEGEGDKVSNDPWFRNHFLSGGEVCPVRALVLWFSVTEGLVPASAPLFCMPLLDAARPGKLVPIPEEKVAGQCVSRADVSAAVKSAGVAQGELGASFGTHSCRIGGATALLQAGASAEVVKLVGRWKSDCWRIYSRHTHTVMFGVSADMAEGAVEKQVKASEVCVR